MMKRWKWFFMFLIISLAVVGCNDNEEIEEQETENRIVLTVMSSGGSDEILKKIVEEQFPEVSLSFLSYPEEEFYTVMKMKLATGNGADFISVQPGYAGSNELYSLAAGGYLASLPENCTEVLGLDPKAKNLMKVDDRVYGISNISLMLGVLYNKRIFDEEGIKVPACWEEFLDCCESLAKKKIQPIIFGGKDKREIQYGIYQIAVNRLYASKPDFDQRLRERKASFSDPNTWDHVLKTYFQLFEKGYIQESCNYLRTSEALEGFQRGEAAMLISNSMHAIPFLMSEELRGEYGFFPLPANERGGQQYVCKGSLEDSVYIPDQIM